MTELNIHARGRHARSPRHPAARIVVRALLTAVAALLVVGLTAGAVLLRQLDGNITADDISDQLGEDRPTAGGEVEPTEALNILLIGSDTRDFEGGEAFGEAAGQRADTTILMHLAADRSRVQFISIPRDSMVQIPDCTLEDGSVVEGGFGQFNSAFAIGGAACTFRTVESVTGVSIDHYAIVNFAGFKDIVTALGGVRVCLPEAVEDPASGLDLPAGETVVDGDQALSYVRARKIGNGSDTQRIERQQAFLSSVVQEVTSSGLLLRPDRLIGVLDAGTRSLTTDPELASVPALTRIALSVQSLPAENATFVTVPNEPWSEDPNRLVWTEAADAVWAAVRTDAPLPGQEPEPPPGPVSEEPVGPLTVPPDEIAVTVLNAGADGGAAGAAAAGLALQGFDISRVADAETTGDGVVVRVPPGQDEAARTVAAAFAGARLVADDAATGIVVELGAGAPAVQEVPNRLGTGPLPDRAPAGAPSPEPSIEVRTATEDICAAA